MNKFSFTISARVGNHIAIRYLYFNYVYPYCIHKEKHLVKWLYSSSSSILSSLTTHCLPGITMCFFSSFRSSENPRSIFMTHISQVNNYEPIFIHLNAMWVFHPLTFEYKNLWRYSIIDFSNIFNVSIINIFLPCAIFCIYSDSTILALAPTVLFLSIECEVIYIIRLPWFNHIVWTSSQQINHFLFWCFTNRNV
jgi:hypothetical protein